MNELDIAPAKTELTTTEAGAAQLARRRAELENAIAILVVSDPFAFRLEALEANDWNPQPPPVPAGLPERQLASANARIGAAKAAFFPVLTLTGSGGYVSGDLDSLKWLQR